MAYKRLDIVIKRLIGFAVRSKFSATDRSENTSRRAGKHITFVGKVSDAELRTLYQGAVAFINPQEEDLELLRLNPWLRVGRSLPMAAAGP